MLRNLHISAQTAERISWDRPVRQSPTFNYLLDLVDFFCDMEAELPFFMKLQVKGLETENE
jgi:hypothetical protein